MQLRPATADDFTAIVQLLQETGIGTEDLNPAHTAAFLLLSEGAEILACGAVERFNGRCGVVRSVAVRAPQRGQGLATRLMRSLETHARLRGQERLYLLTESAAGFFARLGYVRCEWSEVPEAVRESGPFSRQACAQATCMEKRLSEEV